MADPPNIIMPVAEFVEETDGSLIRITADRATHPFDDAVSFPIISHPVRITQKFLHAPQDGICFACGKSLRGRQGYVFNMTRHVVRVHRQGRCKEIFLAMMSNPLEVWL
jgi:hypothetical protein